IYISHDQKLLDFNFILTPGHSPDSMCIILDDYIITGDLIFETCIGRTDFIFSDINKMQESLQKIKTIFQNNLEKKVISGHGMPTTVKTILACNQYII
ncbi:MAG: MBL fold metallo-hydrolase, partial [Mycoplasma sp.]